MYINGIEVNQSTGRATISTVGLAPGALGNGGFLFNTANNVRQMAISAAPPVWSVNGFGMAVDSRQNLEPVLPSGEDIRINGARVDSAEGRISVSTTAPIAFWNQGWPMSALGELCID